MAFTKYTYEVSEQTVRPMPDFYGAVWNFESSQFDLIPKYAEQMAQYQFSF